MLKSTKPKFNYNETFKWVKDFIEKGPINKETQEKLEKGLYNSMAEFNNQNSNEFKHFPKSLRTKRFSHLNEWDNYIDNLKSSFEQSKDILNKKEFEELTDLNQKRVLFIEIVNSLQEYQKSTDKKNLKSNINNNIIIGKMLVTLLTILQFHDTEDYDTYNKKNYGTRCKFKEW